MIKLKVPVLVVMDKSEIKLGVAFSAVFMPKQSQPSNKPASKENGINSAFGVLLLEIC